MTDLKYACNQLANGAVIITNHNPNDLPRGTQRMPIEVPLFGYRRADGAVVLRVNQTSVLWQTRMRGHHVDDAAIDWPAAAAAARDLIGSSSKMVMVHMTMWLARAPPPILVSSSPDVVDDGVIVIE